MKKLLSSTCLLFLAAGIMAQPTNNNCSLTSPLLTSASTYSPTVGTVVNATLDGSINTCSGTERYDVWYRFTAQSSNPIIYLNNIGSNFSSPGLQISAGCATAALACGTTTVNPTGLSIGTIYYIRVFSTGASATAPTSNGGFEISVVDPPANDLCSNAVNLGTINGTCAGVTGTLYQSTRSNPTSSSCGNNYDVWYTFTLPAGVTIATITVTLNTPTSLSNSNTFIELFNTANCTVNSTTTGGCNDISVARRYTGLTAGGTYTFRVNTSVTPTANQDTWGFGVCVIPFNDQCAEATLITAGTTLDGNVFGATSSGVAVGTCTGNPDDDVWYKFVAPFSYATLTLSNIGSNLLSNSKLQLFSGSCGSFTPITCANNTINTAALTAGVTYFVRVYSTGGGQSGFSFGNCGYRLSLTPSAIIQVTGGRMNEVYQQQILSAPQVLADPWEVTLGPDNKLWITEAKGYRIYRYDPSTGVRDTVLDISQGSTFLPAAQQIYNCQFSNGAGAQGGFAGLALHPKLLDPDNPRNYVYVGYVYSQTSSTVFVNRIVRFEYNPGTGKLQTPVTLCDTLPGSSDHNSQRMIIAPVGDTSYLFYASGDMGAGQFGNHMRTIKAQFPNSYEGKILRFNLEEDGNGGSNDWIPSGAWANPYNGTLGVQSAVWAIGIRNNQGFAYDTAKKILYGSSHGPFSDDEINVLQSGKNYGHPLVIGYSWDNNANSTTAGASPGMSPAHPSSCPLITNEVTAASNLGTAYKDPLFSGYPSSPTFPTLNGLWSSTTGANAQWPSEGWSGMELYTNKIIPGWYKSLIASSLKWGRLVRLRLDTSGIKTGPNNSAADTVSYFGSANRFRDLSISPNGKDFYVIMDRSTTTSGPSSLNPSIASCAGCIQKYSFLGYNDAGGKSSIPKTVPVTIGKMDTCNAGTPVTITGANNNIWVPITGPDGNILAEINANGKNLGLITSSFYQKSGAVRSRNGVRYLNRSITISPANTFTGTVKVRLYITKADFDTLAANAFSGISTIADLKILKNNDPSCLIAVGASTTLFTPSITGADLVQDTTGYVLQADNISSFSTFYFAGNTITLPLDLITFTGSLQSNNTTLLKWKTVNENNTSMFDIERSIDGINFNSIGNIAAAGNSTSELNYSLIDNDVISLQSRVIYYRLKIVDIDGSNKYSQVISITLSDITSAVSIAPNPVNDRARISILSPTNGRVQYKLMDNHGRTIMTSSIQVKKGGDNFVFIDMKHLSAGTYYLKVTGEGINNSVKVQKL